MMKIFQKNLESRNICVTLQSRMTNTGNAEIAQLVEHNLAKVGVASSSLVFRSLQGRPSGRPFPLSPDTACEESLQCCVTQTCTLYDCPKEK